MRTQVDLLRGAVFRSMIAFALPIMGSNFFQQLYNTMDTVIIGHLLGDTALAAVGASTPVYDLLVGFALGVGNGLPMVVARSFGTGDRRKLKKTVATAIVIGLLITAVLTVLSQLILHPVLRGLHTPEQILEESYSYISVITRFMLVMFAYNLCAGLLQAIGNCVMPLVFLMISSGTNIVLDLLLIGCTSLGIQGAAVATVLAQALSVVLCLIYISRKCQILIPKREHFTKDGRLYQELLTQGLSVGFMGAIVAAGSVILQSGINSMGYLIIAGHTAARKLFMFCNMPISAMAQTVNTFVAQNRGANQRDRIRKAMRCSYLYFLAVAAVITLLMLLFAPWLVQLISGSGETVVLENGALYLRIVGPFYAVLGIVLATRYALQGLGHKILPLFSSVIELLGKVVFVVLFIPRFQYLAVIFCEPVIWGFMAVELVVVFYRNPYIRGNHLKEKEKN